MRKQYSFLTGKISWDFSFVRQLLHVTSIVEVMPPSTSVLSVVCSSMKGFADSSVSPQSICLSCGTYWQVSSLTQVAC